MILHIRYMSMRRANRTFIEIVTSVSDGYNPVECRVGQQYTVKAGSRYFGRKEKTMVG